jgi:uncharacterized metal-binding protein
LSNGIEHDRGIRIINLPSAFLFSVIVTLLVDKLAGSFAFILFYLGGFLARAQSPDSDIDHETYQDFFVLFIEPYAHKIWYLFWLPYRKLVPHRSWISHFPIIGSLIRIFYLLIPCFLLAWFIPLMKEFLKILIENWDLSLYFICGIIWADILHILMDFNLTFRKIMEFFMDSIIPK